MVGDRQKVSWKGKQETQGLALKGIVVSGVRCHLRLETLSGLFSRRYNCISPKCSTQKSMVSMGWGNLFDEGLQISNSFIWAVLVLTFGHCAYRATTHWRVKRWYSGKTRQQWAILPWVTLFELSIGEVGFHCNSWCQCFVLRFIEFGIVQLPGECHVSK